MKLFLVDKLGVDFFGVGEHHRTDFAVSSPEVILAAIAGRTSRIRLGSAVTVLSSDENLIRVDDVMESPKLPE
jgi:alkanesulfonate monooxygenase SsuD/methylene tetrahydromethanopterin reductase-like flavin-dependent oxidoreductase (luciferase family)